MTKRIGYLRISTQEQAPDRQLDGLNDICDELRVETLAAVAKTRPIFDALLGDLDEGDTFVVWDLERAFRSTVDAISTAGRLRERGIHFQIINLNVDTSTPAGKLVYTVMAAQAEFERSNLIKRTKEGMAAARRRGKSIGRPRSLSREQILHAQSLLEDGKTKAEVAGLLNCHPRTISRALGAANG